MSYLQLGEDKFGYARDLQLDQELGGIFDGVKKFFHNVVEVPKKLVRKVIGAEDAGSASKVQGYLEAKVPDTSTYIWPGGSAGDVDQYGIPYGTNMAEASVMMARAAAANPNLVPSDLVAAPPLIATPAGVDITVPKISVFSGDGTIMGIPTMYALGGAAVLVVGAVLLSKRKK